MRNNLIQGFLKAVVKKQIEEKEVRICYNRIIESGQKLGFTSRQEAIAGFKDLLLDTINPGIDLMEQWAEENDNN